MNRFYQREWDPFQGKETVIQQQFCPKCFQEADYPHINKCEKIHQELERLRKLNEQSFNEHIQFMNQLISGMIQ